MPKKIKKDLKKKKHRRLVISRIEGISKNVLRNYHKEITKLIGNSPGVYALYDGDSLYYVGKSVDLKRRVIQHLKDRHFASWTHFSLYIITRTDFVDEIESLLIRIANPKGNRAVPEGKATHTMLDKLKLLIKKKQKREFEEMFRKNRKESKVTKHVSFRNKRTLRGLVSKPTTLFKTYKGREYKAILEPNGVIRLGNKNFATPTAAAKTIIRRPTGTVDGWRFWYLKDSNGEWLRLSDYKK